MIRSPMPQRTQPMPKCKGLRKSRPARRKLAVVDGAWLDAVRSIPCCVRCGQFGVEAAHRNYGKGGSQKTDDVATAALCQSCHHDLDNGNTFTREDRRSILDKAIVDTLIQLARLGLIGAIRKGE